MVREPSANAKLPTLFLPPSAERVEVSVTNLGHRKPITNLLTTVPIDRNPADQPANEAEAAHTTLIDLLPALSPEEEEAFDESVGRTGRILHPIDVDEYGNILDGFRRKRAADKHGIPCPTHLVAGLTDREKREYRLEVNLNRRHLSTADRKSILEKLLHEDPGRNDTWLGELTRLDPKTVKTVRECMEARSEIPTLTSFRTRSGGNYPRLTRIAATSKQDLRQVQEKAKELRSENMPGRPVTRRTLAKHVRRQRRHDLSVLPVPGIGDDRFRLEVCDFRDLVVSDGSVGMVFADIPYSREWEPYWEKLAGFASRVLKPGGHFLCMSGQDCLPGIMTTFASHLDWVWPLAVLYPGNNQAMIHHKKVRTGWKPILWFSKGKYEPTDEIIDTFSCTGRQQKEYGDWQQGVEECQHYIKLLTQPGDLVCDPCLGHGTTGVACKRLGRRFVGCDIRQDRVDDTKRRLAQEGLEEGQRD